MPLHDLAGELLGALSKLQLLLGLGMGRSRTEFYSRAVLGPTPPGVNPRQVYTVANGSRYAYVGIPVSASIEEKRAALMHAQRELCEGR
jgi:hypothetical protein